MKQTSTNTEVSLQEEGRESSSFSNKQLKYRSLPKSYPTVWSPNKQTEVIGALIKCTYLLPQKSGPKVKY